jgi:hypothetical protein
LPSLFTFDTTHHALWAEEIAAERGIACGVLPPPPAAGARCNLALETLPDGVTALARHLEDEGVPYRLYPDPGREGAGG